MTTSSAECAADLYHLSEVEPSSFKKQENSSPSSGTVSDMNANQILLLVSTFGFCCSSICRWPFIGLVTETDPSSSHSVMNCLKKCLQASCSSVNYTSSDCKMASTSHPLELAIAHFPSRLAGACQDHSCKLGTICKPEDNGSYSCRRRNDTPHCSTNFHKTPKCRFLNRPTPKKSRDLNTCGNLCIHLSEFLCGGFSYDNGTQDCRLFHHERNLLDLPCAKNPHFDSYRRDCYFV